MGIITTKNLKGDLFGGITAGIVALPLALAFGIQAFGGIDHPQASSIGALAGLVEPHYSVALPLSLAAHTRKSAVPRVR